MLGDANITLDGTLQIYRASTVSEESTVSEQALSWWMEENKTISLRLRGVLHKMKHAESGNKKDTSLHEEHKGGSNTVMANILHGNVLHMELLSWSVKTKTGSSFGNSELYAIKSQTCNLQDNQTVTLQLENGKYIRFQIDIGAGVNI